MPTANVSYALLDGAVIAGRGDEPVVEDAGRVWSHARLLEEVAALGGVLRHLGVAPGVACVVDLPSGDTHDLDAVLAALAVARLGGVVTTDDDAAAPVVVTTVEAPRSVADRPRLVRSAGAELEAPDLDRVVMIRAGRTDPAGAAVVDHGSAYSPTRTVAEELAALAATTPPYDAATLRELLQV